MADVLQISALALLPIGIALMVLAFGSPVLAAGVFLTVLAPELCLVGRELDIGGDKR